MSILAHADIVVRDMKAMMSFYTNLLECSVVEDTVVHGEHAEMISGNTAHSMRLVCLRLPKAKPGQGTLELLEAQSGGAMIELLEFHFKDGNGLAERADARLRPSILNLTIAVEGIDELLARAPALGGTVVSESKTIDLPNLGCSQVAFLRDPEGNLVELVEVQLMGLEL